MKKLLLIFIVFISVSSNAQLSSLVVRNDTLFNFDPSTGIYTQLTKLVPPMAGQSGKVISTNGAVYTWVSPFDGIYSSLTGKPDLSVYAAIATTDSMRTNIYDALNGKQAAGSYLTTTGNGSGLTGLTASQLGLGNVTNESKATMFTSPTFTGTVGFPAGTNFTTTGNVGYSTGAGSTVTQATSKTTGVTINKLCGQITMNGAALAAGAEVAFTVTNSTVAATDVIIVNVRSVGTAGSYLVSVGAVSAGSFSITVSNASAGSLSQAVVLNYTVIKSVSN